ncbi:MAG: hypothetical protein RI947_138 [Candidatus Parcubacteria bacterium]|jgi:hypothetical protein
MVILVTVVAGGLMIMTSPEESAINSAIKSQAPGAVSGLMDSAVATNSAKLSEPVIKDTVETYLAKHVAQRSAEGITLCAQEMLGSRQEELTIYVYVWAVCQEYTKNNGIVEKGTELSTPVVLTAIRAGQNIEITGYRIPTTGKLYKEEIRSIFPELLYKQLLLSDSKQQAARVRTLQNIIEAQKNKFF